MITLGAAYVSAAPGGVVELAAQGMAAGPATIVLPAQGTSANTPVTIAGVVANDGAASTLTFTMPDGVVDDSMLITDSAGNTATGALSVRSQYVTTPEYATAGEGLDLTDLAPGELDRVLQRASAYAEGFLGYPFRLLPNVLEQHTWRGPSERSRPMTRVYLNRWPCVSLDVFRVRVSNTQYATFASTDIVVNNAQRYIEVLSYAVASFTLLGAIQNLGLVANIVEVGYTSGYPLQSYPYALKEAVTMIATELLDYRGIQEKGFGGLAQVKEGQVQYNRRDESFGIPLPAQELLRSLVPRLVR